MSALGPHGSAYRSLREPRKTEVALRFNDPIWGGRGIAAVKLDFVNRGRGAAKPAAMAQEVSL